MTREEFDSLRALVDQSSRGVAQLVDLVGKLHIKFDQGFSDLREEIRAGDEAVRQEMHTMGAELREEMQAMGETLRAEMRAGDEGVRQEVREMGSELRKEVRQGFAAQGERIDMLTSEQRLVQKAFSEMTTAWSNAEDAVRPTARSAGREAALEWVSITDGKLENLETRLSRLEQRSETGS